MTLWWICLEYEGVKPPAALLGSLACYLGVEQVSSFTPFYVPTAVSDLFIGQIHL